jgi:tryptophanase
VIEAIIEVLQQRNQFRPREIAGQPRALRHFAERFREL